MDRRIGELFQKIEDPRVDRTKKQPLESILYIVLCGTMAGVESWIGYEDYAEAHEETLKEFIDLPHGIPSHDTIARVISALNVEEFSDRFESFTQELIQQVKGTLAIDGKTMRRSFDSKKNLKAKHIVSAWATGCKLVLAQERTEEKSNEITAIPELLKRFDLQGQIVTMDAMGCQREICEQITEEGGDYVISLKGNQGTLHKDVKLWFESSEGELSKVWEEWGVGRGLVA